MPASLSLTNYPTPIGYGATVATELNIKETYFQMEVDSWPQPYLPKYRVKITG